MKKSIFILILILFSYQLIAQREVIKTIQHLSIASRTANYLNNGVYIEGSPYENKEFIDGVFYQKSATSIETKTRLNYFESNFEFMLNDKTYLVDPTTIDSIIVNDSKYVYKTLDIKGNAKPRIVSVIELGEKNSLFRFTEVEFKSEVKASGYVEPKPASFNWLSPVYIFEINGNCIMLSNLKKISDLFPEKKNEIKKFIKDNKISKSDPDELKKLLHYLNHNI